MAGIKEKSGVYLHKLHSKETKEKIGKGNRLFHRIYGIKNNTVEQLIEFLKKVENANH